MMDTIYTYKDDNWKSFATRHKDVSPADLMMQVADDLEKLCYEKGSRKMRKDVPDDVAACLVNAKHLLTEVWCKVNAGEPFADDEFTTWRENGGRRSDGADNLHDYMDEIALRLNGGEQF